MAVAGPAAGAAAGSTGAGGAGGAARPQRGPVYRNPDVAEARQRRERRQVQPGRHLSKNQIGQRVAAGRRKRAREAAAAGGQDAAGWHPDAPSRPASAAADAPAPDAASPAPGAAASAPAAAKPGKSYGVAGEGAGAFLALLAWPFIMNFARGGKSQAWAWVAAKFWNSTTASTTLPKLPKDFTDPFPAGTKGA